MTDHPSTPSPSERRCILLGAPVHAGAGLAGCDMGPAALRVAGLPEALRRLGLTVEDRGNLQPPGLPASSPGRGMMHAPEVAAWTTALADAAYAASAEGTPVFLGGDHSLSAGTIAGLMRRAAEDGEPLFVLWLDAHSDFHTPQTTESGNIHGMPVAYLTGQPGFEGVLPPLEAPLDAGRMCMIGLRSVDAAEKVALAGAGITVHDMRAIDEHGIVKPLRAFLEQVAAAGGRLHVSLDVDFLDPGIAPGVGTTVPGGATYREAHLVMELLYDSGLVRSLDVVELNPFLDERGRTALLMVDLLGSLMGRHILQRPGTGRGS
ncbi:MAG: arginase [Janthinobacterium lividum]